MTTIVIDEKITEGKLLMGMIRAAKKLSKAIVAVREDDVMGSDSVDCDRIPGLSYTDEDRREAVLVSMEEFRETGKFYTTEELKMEMAAW